MTHMKPTDLPLLTSVSRPTVHPSGGRAVVSVSRPDLDADTYLAQLWTVPLTGGAPRRLTRGIHDSSPAFSPDGSLLAFVRSAPGEAGQLYVVDAAGGEPVQVTDRKLGVAEFRWSPDGARIAFLSREPEHGRYGTVDDLTAPAEPPRHITTLKYKANGLGFSLDRRSQVFLVAVPDVYAEPWVAPAPRADDNAAPSDDTHGIAPAVQLTHDDAEYTSLSFSADGGHIAVVAARHPERDLDLRSDIFSLAVDGLAVDGVVEPVDLTGGHGHWGVHEVRFGSGDALFFLATDLGESGTDFVGRNDGLYVIEAPGAAPRRLTDPTIDLGESSISTAASDRVLVQNRSRGTLELLEVSLDGTVKTLVSGNRQVLAHEVAGGVTVVTVADATTSADVAVLRDGVVTVLTDFSAPLRGRGISEPQELTVMARDGHPVHGWVVPPEGEGPHPVLLNIHGGPFAQYSGALFDEPQVYAGAGYAVVMCNPRGSAGYGEDDARAIRGAMGTVDFTDVLDFLDGALAAHPSLDAQRLGIMGGSYGGYLTAWTIAHDHRFAAAIVERGFLDPAAFIGPSDIGTFFGDEYVGTDEQAMREQSPHAFVGSVRTPTLVVHSAEDLRCPLDQAERYYAALKRNGVPAELLIFPGENHELSRSGQPRHRLQRFEAILDWWARYLPVSTRLARD
jgi:dipeptidyl aminopeptidase/acylaminoacyl peptidase